MKEEKKAEGVLENVITTVCFKAIPLSTRKLVKLVYLADVYHYQMFGKRLTDVHFKHYRYGAWSPEIEECVEELCDKGILTEEIVMTASGNPACVPKPAIAETVIDLSEEGKEALNAVLRDWGDKSPDEVVKFTKSALPFINTPYDEEIDFARCDPMFAYAKEEGISVEQAAMEDIVSNKDFMAKILKADKSLREGGRILTHKEVFGSAPSD